MSPVWIQYERVYLELSLNATRSISRWHQSSIFLDFLEKSSIFKILDFLRYPTQIVTKSPMTFEMRTDKVLIKRVDVKLFNNFPKETLVRTSGLKLRHPSQRSWGLKKIFSWGDLVDFTMFHHLVLTLTKIFDCLSIKI